MKNRFGLGLFLLLNISPSLFAVESAATRESLIKLPSFGGTVSKEGSEVQVSGNRGAFRYSLPLPTLPSRGGQSAQIAFSYSQFTGSEGTGLGSGWSFSVPSIAIGDDEGVPRRGFVEGAGFAGTIRASGEKLVFVSKDQDHLHYLPERSQDRVEYLYFDDPLEIIYLGRYGQTEMIKIQRGWDVRHPDGRREIFSGDEADAEGDFSGTVPQVTRWPLKLQLKRVNGHIFEAIQYVYQKDSGYSYLVRILQSGGASRYDFEMKAKDNGLAIKSSYRQGFLQEDRRLYTRLKAIYNDEVRQQWCFLHRTFVPTTNSFRSTSADDCTAYMRAEVNDRLNINTSSVHSELKALLRYGGAAGSVDAATEREPLIYFAYADADLSKKTDGTVVAKRPFVYETVLENEQKLDLKSFTLADVDQDSLIDLIVDRQGKSYYYQGGGDLEKSFREKREWTITGENGEEVGPRLQQQLDYFVDINGDSLVDILRFEKSDSPFFRVYKGDGRGHYTFSQKNLRIYDALNDQGMTIGDLAKGRGQLLDLNRDGITDYLSLTKNSQWLVCYGKVDSALSFECGTSPTPKPLVQTYLSQEQEYRLSDMNGDGLVDFVTFEGASNFCFYPQTGVNPQIKKNLPPLFGASFPGSSQCQDQGLYKEVSVRPGNTLNLNNVWLVDVNADGIVDLADYEDIRNTSDPDAKALIHWLPGLGDGGFGRNWRKLTLGRALTLGQNLNDPRRIKIADIDADGQREILLLNQAGDRVFVIDFNRYGDSQLPKAGLLTGVEFESGLRYDVMYATSSDEYRRDLQKYTDEEVRALHFPASVVKRYAISDGRVDEKRSRAEVREFIYHRPFYNPEDRSFQGFESVEEILYDENTLLPSGMDSIAATHRLALTRRSFYSGVTGDLRHLAGQLKSESWFAMQADEEFQAQQQASLAIDPKNALLNTLALYSRNQSLPCADRSRCELLQSKGYIWSVVARSEDKTSFVRLDSAWSEQRGKGAESCKVEQPADGVLVSEQYYRYENASNLVQEEEVYQHELHGPAGIPIPERRLRQTYQYMDLPDIGIYGLVEKQEILSGESAGSLDLDQVHEFEYFPANGRLKSTTVSRRSSLIDKPVLVKEALDKVKPLVKEQDYDSFGNIHTQTLSGRNPETLTYTNDGTFAKSFRDSNGDETTIEADAKGRPHVITDPRGLVTMLSYDSLNRSIRTSNNQGYNEVRSYRLGRNFQPTLIMSRIDVQREKQGAIEALYKLVAYNTRGDELANFDNNEYLDARGEKQQGVRAQMFKEFNRHGQVISVFTPFQTNFSTIEELFQKSFILDGRIGEESEARTSFIFDAFDRPVYSVTPAGSENFWSYAAWGSQHRQRFSRSGRTLQTCESSIGRGDVIHGRIDAEGQVHLFKRDAQEALRSVQLAAQKVGRTLGFDSTGQMDSSIVPEVRSDYFFHNSVGQIEKSWTYDSLGLLRFARSLEYDAAGRIRRLLTDGELLQEISYDQYSEGDLTFIRRFGGTENTRGLMTRVAVKDPNRLYDYTSILAYDGAARVKARQVTLHNVQTGQDEEPFVEVFQYGPDGSLLARTDAFDVTVDLRLNGSMQMAGASLRMPWNMEKREPIVQDILYNPKSQVSRVLYRDGVRTDLSYDLNTLWLKKIQSFRGTKADLQDLSLDFDDLGNVMSIDDKLKADVWGHVNRSARFDYNLGNELIGMSRVKVGAEYGFDTAEKSRYEYAYTPAGLLKYQSEGSEEAWTAGDEGSLLPRGPISQNRQFDSLGQLQSNGRVLQTRFDSRGQLICARTAHNLVFYGYDDGGRRIYKKVIEDDKAMCTDTNTQSVSAVSLYPMDGAIREPGGDQSFLSAGGYRLARVEHRKDGTPGTWFYYLKDHLRSSDVMLSSDSKPVEQMIYKPYGSEVDPKISIKWQEHLSQVVGPLERTHHRFTGHYLDDDTGLYYMSARYYDPEAGTFISPDPLFLEQPEQCVESPIECNLFSYARNNPLKYVDPTGTVVQVGQHGAVIQIEENPVKHMALVLIPDNAKDFASHPLFLDENGQYKGFATLGGQPSSPTIPSYKSEGSFESKMKSLKDILPFGFLTSAPNYKGDAPDKLEQLISVSNPKMADTELIKSLIENSKSYSNSVEYNPLPSNSNGTRNSNSYVSGLLKSVDIEVPNGFSGIRPGQDLPLEFSKGR